MSAYNTSGSIKSECVTLPTIKLLYNVLYSTVVRVLGDIRTKKCISTYTGAYGNVLVVDDKRVISYIQPNRGSTVPSHLSDLFH